MELNWEYLVLFLVFLLIYGFALGFLNAFNQHSVKWIAKEGNLHFKPYAIPSHTEGAMWFLVNIVHSILGVALIFFISMALGIFYMGGAFSRFLFKQAAKQKESLSTLDPKVMIAKNPTPGDLDY